GTAALALLTEPTKPSVSGTPGREEDETTSWVIGSLAPNELLPGKRFNGTVGGAAKTFTSGAPRLMSGGAGTGAAGPPPCSRIAAIPIALSSGMPPLAVVPIGATVWVVAGSD